MYVRPRVDGFQGQWAARDDCSKLLMVANGSRLPESACDFSRSCCGQIAPEHKHRLELSIIRRHYAFLHDQHGSAK